MIEASQNSAWIKLKICIFLLIHFSRGHDEQLLINGYPRITLSKDSKRTYFGLTRNLHGRKATKFATFFFSPVISGSVCLNSSSAQEGNSKKSKVDKTKRREEKFCRCWLFFFFVRSFSVSLLFLCLFVSRVQILFESFHFHNCVSCSVFVSIWLVAGFGSGRWMKFWVKCGQYFI